MVFFQFSMSPKCFCCLVMKTIFDCVGLPEKTLAVHRQLYCKVNWKENLGVRKIEFREMLQTVLK